MLSRGNMIMQCGRVFTDIVGLEEHEIVGVRVAWKDCEACDRHEPYMNIEYGSCMPVKFEYRQQVLKENNKQKAI